MFVTHQEMQRLQPSAPPVVSALDH